MKKENEIKVFISHRNSICSECNEELGRKAWITLDNEKAFCLSCSDLDHLEFLPAGDAALTRRSKKYSKIYAVVLRWSRARKRYERQGLLVEEDALEKAEKECLEDQELREIRNQRRREKEAYLDKQYIKQFATELMELFPNCPRDAAKCIAKHACQKYSGRVGRSSHAKEFNPSALTLAAIAHIRHENTNYDELLMDGYDRRDARDLIRYQVDTILESWK